METTAKFHNNSIKYAKISLNKREKLVRDVIVKNKPISKTAKKLSIKLSTAKLIVKRYKDDGTFFEAKADRLKRIEEQDQIKEKEDESMSKKVSIPIIPKAQIEYIDHSKSFTQLPNQYIQNYLVYPSICLPSYQQMMFYML